MAEAERAVPAAREGEGRAVVAAMRPRQWTKNLLLFAGLLFAAQYDEPSKWIDAFVAFVAYCAASSAAYIVNDVLDAEEDRRHPLKRNRPIAAGLLAPDRALKIAAMLAIFAVAACRGSGGRPWPTSRASSPCRARTAGG